jgi:O-antigen ligase
LSIDGPPAVRLRRSRSSLISALLISSLAIAAGYGVAADLGPSILLAVTLAGLCWRFPGIPVALLLVGPGFLHVFTYVSSGVAVRGDVLASPLLFAPLLIALFAPLMLRAFSPQGRLMRTRLLARRAAGRWLVGGMGALWAILVIRLVGSPAPTYGATKVLGFLAFSMMPSVLVLLSAREERDAERILNAIVVVGGAWLVLSLIVALGRGDLDLYRSDPGQVLGGMNEAGGGLGIRAGSVALVALAGAAFQSRWRFLRIVVAMLAIAVLLLSGHRGSALGFSIGFVTLLAAMWRTRVRRWMPLRAAVLVVPILFGVAWGWAHAPSSIQERLRDPLSQSFTDRLVVQGITVTAWLDSPIFGNGTGSSAFLITGHDQPSFGVVTGIYPHNVTLEVLVELGILGAIVFLASIGGVLWKGWRLLRFADDWVTPAAVATVVHSFVVAQGNADLTISNDLWILSAVLAVALVRWEGTVRVGVTHFRHLQSIGPEGPRSSTRAK